MTTRERILEEEILSLKQSLRGLAKILSAAMPPFIDYDEERGFFNVPGSRTTPEIIARAYIRLSGPPSVEPLVQGWGHSLRTEQIKAIVQWVTDLPDAWEKYLETLDALADFWVERVTDEVPLVRGRILKSSFYDE